ncbi:hypothetical protein NA56DRAFT_756056 [Hyaloscypha hepaticicola]|uniref:Uncharacterized protein n=1 Tax=Hyaloscypha hepaticicola TaxID=2082293 RepID=A0A2J6PGK1_9HELO|nr:hypothetical protein NA56DRAFT_756056 [Hyaloscypha hepaticicola]
MSTSSISVIPLANIECEMDEPSQIKLEACQDISGRNISPVKLIAMLRTKFGIGAYEIQMTRNVYSIRAPRRLSLNEIVACR